MSLITYPTFELSLDQVELVKKAMEYERASLSPNTLRSYKSMWNKFDSWCKANNQPSLPASAETIALFISSLGETVSFSTLDSVLASIEAVHEKAGMTIKGEHALYRRVRKGIRRTHKQNQTLKQARAMSLLDLKMACCCMDNSLSSSRDKALLTLTFFGAFRRSEVVSLDIENLEFSEKGVAVSLLQSKTSATKEIVYIALAKDQDICPVRALKAWFEASQIKEGAVFRSFIKGGTLSGRLSGHAVSAIIKRYFGKEFSGHSARRGLLTSSAEKGTSLHLMMKHARQKCADTTVRYIETVMGFEESSVTMLGI